MLNRDDALKICDTVLAHAKAAGADQCQLLRRTAKKAIETYLRFKADILTGSGHPRGCMLMVGFFTAANACRRAVR